jgi:PAS domain S-box-containing protein
MRILIVDDHEVVRRGVRSLLLTHPEFDICGEAVNGHDAIDKAKELKPDVIVMDISMPQLNGLEATRLVRGILPETEVLILSQHDSPEMIRQAFNAGARGYVVKSSIAQQLPTAIETIAKRQSFVAVPQENSVQSDSKEVLQRSRALERELRESEERFRATFEQAAVGIAHVAPDGRFLRVNERYSEIVGYSKAELLHLAVRDITYKDDIAPEAAENDKVFSGAADRYSIEKRVIRKDGQSIWVNRNVSAVRDNGGQLKYLISVIEDVTDRKKNEQAQFRLAAIVESSGDAIISKDLNGILTSWNAGAQHIFGFTPDEAIGRPITIIVPPELHDEEKEILRKLRNGERIEHYETVRSHKNGARLYVSLTISPIRDAAGRVIGVSNIARDITERKQTEEALKENQELLRAAFSQTYSFLALLTVDGTILEANRAALEGTGFGRRDVIGRKIWEPWWSALPDEQKIVKSALATAARGLAVREECSYCLRDGTVRFADRTLNPVQNHLGEVVMIIASGIDITEQKRWRDTLEEGVRRRTRELEAKNVELERQAQIVRELSGRLLQVQDEERRRIARELHDSVGQMLAAVSMNLNQITSESSALSPEAARALDENVSLIDQLSTEIRTISHLLHPPLLDEIGLQSALRWYIDGFRERSKINVELDLPENFGRLPRDFELTLFRAVQECLTNIHRHSESPTASVRVSRSPHDVSLEVKDQGKGISPADQATLSAGKLTGVGLRGMRERLRQLGGHLDVQSNSHGTTVLVRLPLTAAVTATTSNAAATASD